MGARGCIFGGLGALTVLFLAVSIALDEDILPTKTASNPDAFPRGTINFINSGIKVIDQALDECKLVPSSVAIRKLRKAICDAQFDLHLHEN